MIDLFSAGEVSDILADMVFTGTPATIATRMLEVRDTLRYIVDAGGVRAIDYESAGEPRGSGGTRATVPRGLFAVEVLKDVDALLTCVYGSVCDRRAWRVWCLYRRPVAAWKLGALAALEGVTERQARYMVEKVDGVLFEELGKREWRLV
jgi:hypothetical protein